METLTERIKNYFNDLDHEGIRGLRGDLKTMCISSLVDEDDKDGRDTLSWVYNKIDGILELIEISKEKEEVEELKQLANSEK